MNISYSYEGAIIISAKVKKLFEFNRFYIDRVYYYYTKKQAKNLFKEYLKNNNMEEV